MTRLVTLTLAALLTLPALAAPLNGIQIEPESNEAGYKRSLYKLWIDADSDGQDSRQEVLIEESLIGLTFDFNGKVSGGLWVGPYCGFIPTNPSELDIDHMVPLKEAHLSGGHAWTPEKRQDYANGLTAAHHLIAVKGGCNRSKQDHDPAEWMPPNRTYWCTYLEDWIAIKEQWEVSMDQAEAGAIMTGLKVCDNYNAGDSPSGRH